MANVPGQGEEEGPSKEVFDGSGMRPIPNSQAQAIQQPVTVPFQTQTAQVPQTLPTSQIPHPSMVSHAHGTMATVQPSPIGASVHYAASVDPRQREHLSSYDIFSEINVAPGMMTAPRTDLPKDGSTPFTGEHKVMAGQSALKAPESGSYYANVPIAGASSRVTKRTTRGDLHEQSSSPSQHSPTMRGVSGQSSLERRKAHRAYTQKSRNKVNARFEALLDALPTPPPRLNPRSKAEILEYATETVIRLVSQNNKLELHLALSSSPQLEAWLLEQTQSARTVREVCQPIMRLFTIGLDWNGAEVWAIDARAPTSTASLGQAWTFVPPPSGRRPSREEETRMSELGGFLDTGKGSYYATTSNEAVAVVYRTGKPAWISCEYNTQLGLDDVEYTCDRTRLASSFGISDVLFIPLILYNHVQIVVKFYNMRARTATGNPTLQPNVDPKSSIKVASEAIAIIARRFCSLPGVSEFAEQ